MFKELLHKKNAGFKNLMIRRLLLFSLIMTTVLAAYVIFVGHDARLKETKQKVEFRLSQYQEFLDMNLRNLERYFSVIAESQDLNGILSNASLYHNDALVSEITKTYLGGGMYDEWIDDFTLLDTLAMLVIGSEGVFQEKEYPGHEELAQALLQPSERRVFWHDTNENELSYYMKLPLGASKTTAISITYVRLGYLKRLAHELVLSGEHMAVINEKGNIVFSVEDEGNPIFSELTGLPHGRKASVHIPGSGTYLIGQKQSRVVGWTYVFLYKKPRIFEFNNVSVAVCALLILSITGTVFLFSVYRLYKPVEQLIKKVGPDDRNSDYISGLKYIEKRLTNLSSDANLLAETVKHQQDRIQQMFELRLINDGIRSEEEWDTYFKSLNLPQYERFATTVMVLDLRYNSKLQEGLNEDAICLQMIDDMPEAARRLLWMPPVYNSCTIFSLVGADSEDELLRKIQSYFNLMQEFSEEMTGFSILMGVSGTHKDHRHIRLAYRESATALMKNKEDDRDYHEIEAEVREQGADTVDSLRFYVEKLPNAERESADGYDVKYEIEVQHAVKEADIRRAYRATDRFAEYLLTVKTTDDALYQSLRYADRIVMTAMEYNIPISEVFPQGLRTAYRVLLSELEPRRIRRYLKQYFIDPVIEKINERMKQGSHLVMEQIDALLIQTHGNLLLTECADQLGLNPNYIWKILKMERGKSFTEYAEKYKIEEAKKLLSETDLSVQEIAMKLDYANAQNFIRFFSKATGITPGKFRKMY